MNIAFNNFGRYTPTAGYVQNKTVRNTTRDNYTKEDDTLTASAPIEDILQPEDTSAEKKNIVIVNEERDRALWLERKMEMQKRLLNGMYSAAGMTEYAPQTYEDNSTANNAFLLFIKSEMFANGMATRALIHGTKYTCDELMSYTAKQIAYQRAWFDVTISTATIQLSKKLSNLLPIASSGE